MGRLVRIPKYKSYDYDKESLEKALNDYKDMKRYVALKSDDDRNFFIDPRNVLGELVSFDKDSFTIDLEYNTEIFEKMKSPHVFLYTMSTRGGKSHWEVSNVVKILVGDIQEEEK